MDIDETNTYADPPLGSRWAQKWVHMWAQVLVIFLVYVTKGNMWATDVPPTTPDSCYHPRNDGCHPAAGCNGQGTDASSFHPKCITDASTTRGHKMPALFIQPGTGRRRDSGVRQCRPEEYPHQRQKERRLGAKPLKESHQEAFSKESEVIKVARQAHYMIHCPSFEQEG